MKRLMVDAMERSQMTPAAGIPEAGRPRRRIGSLAVEACCPPTCQLTHRQIEGIAEHVSILNWSDFGASERMGALIESSGGEMKISTPPALMLLVAEHADVFAVTRTSAWDMAVAIGHLTLHFEEHRGTHERLPLAVPAYIGVDGPLARARAEANWFASALLMPREKFEGLWRDGGLRGTAQAFALPLAPVAARARHLGLE